MNPQTNVNLKQYSTMRLGGTARYLVEARHNDDIGKAVAWAAQQGIPVLPIGQGSNIIFGDEGYAGLIILNRLTGFTITDDVNGATVTAAGGESWDSVVERSVQAGLSGIESLSLIPGTAGAAPVQNIGAYGQQLSDTLTEITAYDTTTNKIVLLPANDCEFGYRASRFNRADKGRFIITQIKLRLTKTPPQPPFYRDVDEYLKTKQLTTPTAQDIRAAVMAIRTQKLPDPHTIANTGSFFGNPVISAEQFARLEKAHPEVNTAPAGWSQPPRWILPDGSIKLAAGWLVEQAGYSDYHDVETGMATWHKQNLVLVNEHAKTTRDLLTFKKKIVTAVQEKFDITLQQEPELIS